MKEFFLADVEVTETIEPDRHVTHACAGKWEGVFTVSHRDEEGLAELDCGDEALSLALMTTGARRALTALSIRRIIMEKPDSEVAALLLRAGYRRDCSRHVLPYDLDFLDENVRVVFAGGVPASHAILSAMIRRGANPCLAVGCDDKLAHRFGHVDLGSLCEDNGIQLLRTADINSPAIVEAVRQAEPDYLCVFGWGQSVGEELLKAPKQGCLGLIPTELPERAERAPVTSMLIKGMIEGVSSLLWLSAETDAGDLADQQRFPIKETDDAARLYERIVRVQAEQVEEILPRLAVNTLPRVPQSEDGAALWPPRLSEDGRIDWHKPTREIYNKVRALSRPYPGAFTWFADRKLTVRRAELVLGMSPLNAAPGTVIGAQLPAGDGDGALLVACGDGELLALRRVQWEGGEEVSAYKLWAEKTLGQGARLG